MAPKFSPYMCVGFKENHKSQYSLSKIIEIWKQYLDKSKKVGVLLMDLSKAFDTTNHHTPG